MSPVSLAGAVRGLTVSRAVLGGTLLIAPERILARLGGVRSDRAARIYARTLGVRHLTEAIAAARNPAAEVLCVGAAIDTVHGLTMLWLMRLPTRRRLGAWNLASASGFAAAGWWLGLGHLRVGGDQPSI